MKRFGAICALFIISLSVVAAVVPACNPEFKAACTASANCTAGLGCHPTEKTCQCLDSNTYWNGEKCASYKSHGENCSPTVECKSPLKCSEDDTCKCSDADAYWDGAICQSKDRPPVFVRQPQEKVVYFKPGSSLTINFTADGYPFPSYNLHSDSTLRLTTQAILIHPGVFILAAAESADAGVYWCTVSNDHGTAASLNISLVEAYIRDFATQTEENHDVTTGQSLTMPCDQPDSVPPATVTWQLVATDGTTENITASERVFMASNGNLQFRSVLQADSVAGKKYQCVATNDILAESKSGRKNTIDVQGGAQEHAVAILGSNPQANVAVLEGEPLILECLFAGNPTPSVYWEKVGGELPECQHKFKNWRTQLQLTSPTSSDVGDYQCVGINTVAGVDKVSRFTTTVGVNSAPKWTEKPVSLEKNIGDSATFRCSATGTPTPEIKWFLNGEAIRSSPFWSQLTFSATEITFNSVRQEDFVSVQCTASNEHGTDAAYAVLNVFGTPGTITISSSTTTASDKSYGLRWEAPSDGGQNILRYIIKWIQIKIKAGTVAAPVKESEIGTQKEHVVTDVNADKWYKVDDLETGSYYEVTVIAVNAVGESQPSKIIFKTAGNPSGATTCLLASGRLPTIIGVLVAMLFAVDRFQ